ncbi:beta-1,4-glucuronyltransferase 1-like [Ptychodera flava]|uniref:beta-1,4-glucuronyltransferase 1-like n=1 Tax=Ptychodera flava TaxID=63121 RepID=UPI003969C86A
MASCTWRQRCSAGKLIVILVAVIVVLQVVHLVLLSRVDARGNRDDAKKVKPPHSVKKPLHTKTKFSEVGLDSSGNYQVYRFLVASEKITKGVIIKDDVTIVTQCSLNRLHHVLSLVERWNGPISVAIFSAKPNITSIFIVITHLRQCFPKIRSAVSFHLVSPLREMKETQELVGFSFSNEETDTNIPCDQVLPWMRGFGQMEENYAVQDVPYPNNLLRNVAWHGSATEYILVMDIDMLPSGELRHQFKEFILTKKQSMQWEIEESPNLVYVLPVFEINERIPVFPSTRNELIDLWEREQVRQFYQEMCEKCQTHTDYIKWRNLHSVSSGKLNIAYEVEWMSPWEPLYIANRNIPKYDERFKQYGFNRISQVCEVHISGYNFAIMDNAFILHKGFKTPSDFHSQKDEENVQNKLLYTQFKEELTIKYPEAVRQC